MLHIPRVTYHYITINQQGYTHTERTLVTFLNDFL